jgi:hypothetical protein
MLTSSTVAEPGPGETSWTSGGTYAVGDTRIRTTTHRQYICVQANTGRTALPEVDTAFWLDSGPTNKWAMFDNLRNTATSIASPLTVVVTPGVRVDSLALAGVVGDSLAITISSGGATVYSYSKNLSTRQVFNWYDYFFAPFTTQAQLVRFDLPPYTNAVITVTVTNASGNAACGLLVIGQQVFIGQVQFEPVSDALNFSTITRDTFGNVTLVPRRNVPKVNLAINLEKGKVDVVRALRDTLNAVPAVWSGKDDDTDGYFAALFTFGIYRIFSINLKHPTLAIISLELEEV